MRHIGKAYPGNVFAGIKTFLRSRRADLRQAFGISFEGTASMDQLLSQIARCKITARVFVVYYKLLVAPREEPVILSLTLVFLGKTLGEALYLFPVNGIGLRDLLVSHHILAT